MNWIKGTVKKKEGSLTQVGHAHPVVQLLCVFVQ